MPLTTPEPDENIRNYSHFELIRTLILVALPLSAQPLTPLKSSFPPLAHYGFHKHKRLLDVPSCGDSAAHNEGSLRFRQHVHRDEVRRREGFFQALVRHSNTTGLQADEIRKPPDSHEWH